MASQEELQGEIKFLNAMNERLSDEVNFLMHRILYLEDVNKTLLDKVVGSARNLARVTSDNQELEPIAGYVPLRDKIREAEAKAKEEFVKAEKDANKIR